MTLEPQPGWAPAGSATGLVRDTKTNTGLVIAAWIIAVLTLGYMLPWAIAESRGKTNSLAVGLINFLTGWTFIGWIVALVMACTSHQTVYVPPPAAMPPGFYPHPSGSGEVAFWNGSAWVSPPTTPQP